MIHRHILRENRKCNICNTIKRPGVLVLKKKETDKLICMDCLVEIVHRTNEEPMKPENVKCPECGGPMTRRTNKTSGRAFWGCNDYPMCKGSRDTDGMSKQERQQERNNTHVEFDE